MVKNMTRWKSNSVNKPQSFANSYHKHFNLLSILDEGIFTIGIPLLDVQLFLRKFSMIGKGVIPPELNITSICFLLSTLECKKLLMNFL